MLKKIFYLSCFTLFFTACEKSNPNYKQDAQKPELIHKAVRKITDIIVFDIFSPPVASRIYAYSSIAGYEVLINEHLEYQSLAGQVKGLSAVPKPEAGKEYCFPLAAAQAMMLTGKKWTFSDAEMDTYIQNIHAEFKKINMPKAVFENSLQYGEAVANHIIAWSLKDNYKELRSASKYNIDQKSKEKWKPTPPLYVEAVEPHWCEIRTMIMDSASQFKPARPTAFSVDKKSLFYKEAMEVFTVGAKNDSFTRETARYWDDNAIATQVNGHFMTSVKKISPGGHWLNIARAAADVLHRAGFSQPQAHAGGRVHGDCFHDAAGHHRAGGLPFEGEGVRAAVGAGGGRVCGHDDHHPPRQRRLQLGAAAAPHFGGHKRLVSAADQQDGAHRRPADHAFLYRLGRHRIRFLDTAVRLDAD